MYVLRSNVGGILIRFVWFMWFYMRLDCLYVLYIHAFHWYWILMFYPIFIKHKHLFATKVSWWKKEGVGSSTVMVNALSTASFACLLFDSLFCHMQFWTPKSHIRNYFSETFFVLCFLNGFKCFFYFKWVECGLCVHIWDCCRCLHICSSVFLVM